MVQGISRIQLNKNFSDKNLNKIGNVPFKGAAQHGAALKKTIVGIMTGKSRLGAERELIRQGISGSRLQQRKRILDVAFGDINKSGLSKAKAEEDFKTRTQRKAYIKDKMEAGELQTTRFGMGNVQTIGAKPLEQNHGYEATRTKEKMETTKGTMEDIGLKRGGSGFALGNKPPDKQPPAVTPPNRGSRPLGM